MWDGSREQISDSENANKYMNKLSINEIIIISSIPYQLDQHMLAQFHLILEHIHRDSLITKLSFSSKKKKKN